MDLDLKDVVRSRRVLVATIGTEDALRGRKLDVIEEVLCGVNSFPSLTLDHNVVLDCY